MREKKRERGRESGDRGERERVPQTLMLLRKRLLRLQSVPCAEVQVGAFKALAE